MVNCTKFGRINARKIYKEVRFPRLKLIKHFGETLNFFLQGFMRAIITDSFYAYRFKINIDFVFPNQFLCERNNSVINACATHVSRDMTDPGNFSLRKLDLGSEFPF